jgi:hypothetical protein
LPRRWLIWTSPTRHRGKNKPNDNSQ